MSKKLGVWRRARVTAPTLMVCAVWGLATLIQPPVARADDAAAVAPVPLGTGGPADTDVADPLPDSPESAATVDFSTGTARSSFTFKMPPARGNAQPSLALQYNSAAGNGPAGVGWSLSLPSIVRKGTSGLAHFRDDTLNASSNPYRARVRLEYRWATEGLSWMSYLFANDEVFYEFQDQEWYRNRFRAGANLVLSERTDLQVFYQRQDSNNSTPGAINALGVTFDVTFK